MHIPIGFEISHDGVYVSQGANLVLLKDTDGDDRYDLKEVVLSGFDDHDTHHAISAFCADPSGAILMGEGIFPYSNVETVFGPIREPMVASFDMRHKARANQDAQLKIPNPWGIAVDSTVRNSFCSPLVQTSHGCYQGISMQDTGPTFPQTICLKAIRYAPHLAWKLYPAGTSPMKCRVIF